MIEAYLSHEMAEKAEQLTKDLRAEMSQQVLDKIKARVERFCSEELGATPDELDFMGDISVVSGSPAEVIVREAETRAMDLIVVGGHTSTLRDALLGSTARKVTLMSHDKPVLIVPMSKEASWED
jgi:nucleotide-binding universal stress UspA family protein